MTEEQTDQNEVKSLPVDPALLESRKQVAAMARTAWLAGLGAAILAAGVAFGALWLVYNPEALQQRMAETDSRFAAQMAEADSRFAAQMAEADSRFAAQMADVAVRLDEVVRRVGLLEERPEVPAGIREELADLRSLAERRPEVIPELAGQVSVLEERLNRAALDGERLTAEIQTLVATEGALSTELEAHRTATRSVQERLGELESTMSRSPDMLAAVLWIARAAEGSQPFPDRLRAFRAISKEPPSPVLEAAARTGVPSRNTLIAVLPSAVRAAARTSAQPVEVADGTTESDGTVAAVTAWLGALVTIERVDGAAVEGPLGDLLRFTAQAGPGDLGAALALIRELPAGIRAELSGWTADADHRIRLDAEIDRLLDLAFGALG